MAEPLGLAALERLAALEGKATPGEWWHDRAYVVAGRDEQTAIFNAHCGDTSAEWATDADLDFVCALRNACPSLLRLARAGLAAEQESARLTGILTTDPHTDQLRPLCGKHLPSVVTRAHTSATTRTTIYRCLVCGASYDIVEVLS